MARFSAEEKALLAPYVTDTEGDIFAVTGLPGIVGAVYARYSRAQGGFRETLLKEFIERKTFDARAFASGIADLVLEWTGDPADDALRAQLTAAVESRLRDRTELHRLDAPFLRDSLLRLAETLNDGAAVNAAKAQDLIERILIAFGDDSVGELEGAHVSFENVSILSTKEIEDRRIGGSPIEQSTRYVFYDKREEPLDGKDALGNFRYYRDPAVMASPYAAAYVETMDFIFQTYCDLVAPMKAYYSDLKPIEEARYAIREKMPDVKIAYAECASEDERKAFRATYNADIRTKACDTLRALLPLATKTNVGVFGNGRFFQGVLSHCYTSAIPEARDIAARTHAQLDKVIPRYVKRARPNGYLQKVHADMQELAARLLGGIVAGVRPAVDLLDRGETAIARAWKVPPDPSWIAAALQKQEDVLTVAQMLYPYASLPLEQIRYAVQNFSDERREKVIATYLGDRKTRRDRPGRALEAGYPYTFDLCTDFGTYKDLERHRMCTQQRQRFTPMVGFAMPEDLVLAGYADRVPECVARARALYELLKADFPEQASYATLHGSKVRWTLGINDRALMHMIELRTTPQGHPSYRKVCQAMHRLVTARSPWRGEAMRFADHEDYFWSRGDAEAKQRVKEAALDRK